MLIGTGLAVVTFFIFRWAILRFDIKTPAVERIQQSENTLIKENVMVKLPGNSYRGVRPRKQNIRNVDNCITRMRIYRRSE